MIIAMQMIIVALGVVVVALWVYRSVRAARSGRDVVTARDNRIRVRISIDGQPLMDMPSDQLCYLARARAPFGWHELCRTTDGMLVEIQAITLAAHLDLGDDETCGEGD